MSNLRLLFVIVSVVVLCSSVVIVHLYHQLIASRAELDLSQGAAMAGE